MVSMVMFVNLTKILTFWNLSSEVSGKKEKKYNGLLYVSPNKHETSV